MDKPERRTRFETRISLERMFLTRINSACDVHLSGMTQAAINSWRARASEVYDHWLIRETTNLLLEAAVRGELMADNSKDVFQVDRRTSPDSLQELAEILDDKLIAFQHITYTV